MKKILWVLLALLSFSQVWAMGEAELKRADDYFSQMHDRKNFDVKHAIVLYQQAADKGNVLALIALGGIYSDFDIVKDYQKSNEYFKRAIAKNHPLAMYNLALSYENGFGVMQNNQEAAHWLLQAAQAGEMNAQERLADYYAEGRGVKQDFMQTVYWYEKAAEQGSVHALYQLAEIYAEGIGVARDTKKAKAIYQRIHNEFGDDVEEMIEELD